MTLVLNAEKFNYALLENEGSGFKIAIHDHRDKPIMEFSSFYLQSGMVTQIAVSPSITYTSKSAIKALEPTKRNCYEEHEANLTYFPYAYGYRYGMDNCLMNEAIESIVLECG